MFLDIDNCIINLDRVTIISLDRETPNLFIVKIEADKDHILFQKEFRKEEDANLFAQKLAKLLNNLSLLHSMD
jgi:hypothetical protein